MKSIFKFAVMSIALIGSFSARAESGCSKLNYIDAISKTANSTLDQRKRDAIVALRENMVRDLGGVLNPIVDKLVAADEDSKNWFTGELGDLHRKQLIEDLFTTCSLHVDYDFGDALRSILVDLGNKFETMKAQK